MLALAKLYHCWMSNAGYNYIMLAGYDVGYHIVSWMLDVSWMSICHPGIKKLERQIPKF